MNLVLDSLDSVDSLDSAEIDSVDSVFGSWFMIQKIVYQASLIQLIQFGEIVCETRWHYDNRDVYQIDLLRARSSIKEWKNQSVLH